jgi:hypothetical protein
MPLIRQKLSIITLQPNRTSISLQMGLSLPLSASGVAGQLSAKQRM